MNRKLLSTLQFLFSSISILCALPAAVSAAPSTETRSGDWLITSAETIKDRSLQIYGTITIRDGGSLTLENSTLAITGEHSRDHVLKLEEQGTLVTKNSTIGGFLNAEGTPIHTVILMHGGTWDATDTTVQYSYGVNCHHQKPSILRGLRLNAGPRPDAIIVSGAADVTLTDCTFPLAISAYASQGGTGRLDLPVKTPVTGIYDATNVPGAKWKLALTRHTVPDHWFLFVFDINNGKPPLDLTLGDCPKVLLSLLGHNVRSDLTLSSDLASPVKHGNVTLRRVDRPVNVSMWNFYGGGPETDIKLHGTGIIAELMPNGGKWSITGESPARPITLLCSTLDVTGSASLDLTNVHLGRPLTWKPDPSRGEIIVAGTATLTGKNITAARINLTTKNTATVSLTGFQDKGDIRQKPTGGPISLTP